MALTQPWSSPPAPSSFPYRGIITLTSQRTAERIQWSQVDKWKSLWKANYPTERWFSLLQCTHRLSTWPTPRSAPAAQPCTHLGRLPLGNRGQDLSNWALLEPLRPLPGPSGQPQPCQRFREPSPSVSPLGPSGKASTGQTTRCNGSSGTPVSAALPLLPRSAGARKTQRHQGDSLATNAFKISCLYRVVILNSPVRQGSKTLIGLFYKSVRRMKITQRRATDQDGGPHVYQVPVGYLRWTLWSPGNAGPSCSQAGLWFPGPKNEDLTLCTAGVRCGVGGWPEEGVHPSRVRCFLRFHHSFAFAPLKIPSAPPHLKIPAFWRAHGPLESHQCGQPYPLISQNSLIFSPEVLVTLHMMSGTPLFFTSG